MAYSMIVALLVGVLVSLATAQTPFSDCGSKQTKIKSLKVGDCTSSPCELKKGTNITVAMVLEADDDVKSLTIEVVAHLGIIHLAIPVPDPNACHFMKCPMVKGTTDTFTGVMAIGTNYPPVDLAVTIDWSLKSPTAVATCVAFKAKLMS